MTSHSKEHGVEKDSSFEQIVKQYNRKILNLAYDIVGNYEDAKDVAQETFIKAFENRVKFRGEASLSTWLYSITVNLAIDHKRSTKKHVFTNMSSENTKCLINRRSSDLADDPGANVEKQEINMFIERALGTLSKNQRSAFVLKQYHGMKTREISVILKCSESTVREHVFRAVRKLRKELKFLNEKGMNEQ